jgi:hypothetical protein
VQGGDEAYYEDEGGVERRLYLQGLRAMLQEMRGRRGAGALYGHTLRLQPNVTDGARLNKAGCPAACWACRRAAHAPRTPPHTTGAGTPWR